MDLIDDIRQDLVSETALLTNTLRKAKILAAKLHVQEFKDWIRFELDGYPTDDDLPDYRRFRATNLGTFSGPFQSRADNVVLPTYNLPDQMRKFAEELLFQDGIGELESMLASESEILSIRWPQEAVILARDKLKLSNDMVLVDAHKPVSKHIIAGILDSVKNKLLDFILELSDLDFPLEDKSVKPEQRKAVRDLFVVNVYGNDNVIAAGRKIDQSLKKVINGDLKSLTKHFQDLGVAGEDIEALKNAIISDLSPVDDKPGMRVSQWIGRMVSKAATGVWKVSLEVAPKLIMEGLKAYYGW